MRELYHGPFPTDMTTREAQEFLQEVLKEMQTAVPYKPPTDEDRGKPRTTKQESGDE